MNKEEIENYISMVNGRIEKLQSQLAKSNEKLEKIKEHIKIFIPYNYDHYNNEYIDGTTDILSIIDEENK